jgi:hypothetical protein
MYSSSKGLFSVDARFAEEVEPLLLESKVSSFGLSSHPFFRMKCTLPLLDLVINWLFLVAIYQVDLVLFGHVHNYERFCSVYRKECKAIPRKDRHGIDVYDHRKYSAPMHAVIGMAGFSLDKFPNHVSRSQTTYLFIYIMNTNM